MKASTTLIDRITEYDMDDAASVAAHAYCTNPNHLKIFRSANEKVIAIQKEMFKMVLGDPNQVTYVAKMDNKIVGLMSYTTSRHCQLPLSKLLWLMPKFVRVFGKYLPAVLRWRMNWSRHDCKKEHIHFGPIAVHPSAQGKGIGKALLQKFCACLDAANQVGYLETDKWQNVELYEKYGFKITTMDSFMGVQNWFMTRPERKNQ